MFRSVLNGLHIGCKRYYFVGLHFVSVAVYRTDNLFAVVITACTQEHTRSTN